MAGSVEGYDETSRNPDRGMISYLQRMSNVVHTPRPRRKSIKFMDLIDDSSDDGVMDVLTDLVQKKWKLFRASPLHNFKCNAIHLRKYGRKMQDLLSRERKDENTIYEAKFQVLADCKRTVDDAPAVQITITATKENQDPKLVYNGMLMSWGCAEEWLENSVNLPLLLCSGSLSYVRDVHGLLMKFFDSSIERLNIMEVELFWLCAMLPAIMPKPKKNSLLLFRYIVPDCTIGGKVDTEIHQESITEIWKCIRDLREDQDETELLYEDIETLKDEITNHLTYAFKMNYSKIQLDRILSPELYVAGEGSVKIRSTDLADKVLNFLCSLCTLINSSATTSSVDGSV